MLETSKIALHRPSGEGEGFESRTLSFRDTKTQGLSPLFISSSDLVRRSEKARNLVTHAWTRRRSVSLPHQQVQKPVRDRRGAVTSP